MEEQLTCLVEEARDQFYFFLVMVEVAVEHGGKVEGEEQNLLHLPVSSPASQLQLHHAAQ